MMDQKYPFWLGELYLDGELLNEKYGYDAAFEFQILAGKPFFFFESEGKFGISYDWQEYELPVESIIHYTCCSGLQTIRCILRIWSPS